MERRGGNGTKVSVRRYRLVLWGTACLSLLGGALALIGRSMSHASTHGGDWRDDIVVLAVTVVAVVLLGVVLLLSWFARRRETFVAQVRRARPGATVIPAYSARDLWSDAREAGVGTTGIARRLSTLLAVVLVDDTAEVWIRGDREPRWSVRRTGAQVDFRELDMGRTSQPGLRISDGSTGLSFAPWYARTNAFRSIERALVDLGEDPADHLDP